MKKYLIFRTDRVGDFLFSLKLIKIIKLNNPDSEITVISSEKNHHYIKSFTVVDNVIMLKNNIFAKIKLIFNLRKKSYNSIIVHDGKNRSRFISFFLKFKERVICVTNLIDTQLEIIQKVCKKLQLNFDIKCLDFLANRNYSRNNLPFDSYIQLHFDEKWKFSDYIKKYKNIEPSEDELISLIMNIIKKKNLIITTGAKKLLILDKIKNKVDETKVKIYENQNLLELENIVFNTELLITCHGWISHIASANKINQIDIIDESYPYNKWTSHFRNYTAINRKSFSLLSNEIIKKI